MHTHPLMKHLSILSVPSMLHYNSMKIYYKYKRNEIPDYFASFYLHTQAQLTTRPPTRRKILQQIERVLISLKNVFGIILQKNNKFHNKWQIDQYRHPYYVWIAFVVKHNLISKCRMECHDDRRYVRPREPRSWYVNRLLPINHYVHSTPPSILCF